MTTAMPRYQVGDIVLVEVEGEWGPARIEGTEAGPMQCRTCAADFGYSPYPGNSACCPGPWYGVSVVSDGADGPSQYYAEHEIVMTGDRDQLAQHTAEYIATVLMPKADAFHSGPGVTVHYADGQRPPTGVDEIKATLLDGRVWISWLDSRVTAAMRALHGEPTGDTEWLAAAESSATA